MKSMPVARADVMLRLARWENGYVTAFVGAELPGAEPSDRLLHCDVGKPDELYAMLADFHNEWKAWGSLLDCVLDDWGGAHLRFWEPGIPVT